MNVAGAKRRSAGGLSDSLGIGLGPHDLSGKKILPSESQSRASWDVTYASWNMLLKRHINERYKVEKKEYHKISGRDGREERRIQRRR